jgi:hypothetical protein
MGVVARIASYSGNLRAELAFTAELSTGTVILATFLAFCSIILRKNSVANLPILSAPE